jgi:hypothetical protein
MTNEDRVNVFLYLLIRDVLPFGKIEELLAVIESLHVSDTGKHRFSDPNMEAYVRSITSRLLLAPKAQRLHEKKFNAKRGVR